MTLAEALAALGLPPDATREQARQRCRAWVKRAAWDTGTGPAFWLVAAWVDGDLARVEQGRRGGGTRREDIRQQGRDTQKLKRAERIKVARRLHGRGWAVPRIAEHLGVTVQAVYRYLREAA